jgi:hypothetical protein
VTVLTAFPINRRKLRRRLIRAGYDAVGDPDKLRIWRDGDRDAVDTSPCKTNDLSEMITELASQLMGFRPRDGITCGFEGLFGQSPAWPTVLAIARSVAADVPLAILDDHLGTLYLIHPSRGLIGPEEYSNLRSRPSTADFLRGLFRTVR